jgi:hypothetical protein
MRLSLKPSSLPAAMMGLLLACAGPSTTTGDIPPSPDARLQVINRSSSDMDIYVARGGTRIRLGFAAANDTTWFSLTSGQVPGVGTATFIAAPLTPPGRTISSEPVSIGGRDVITLEIPPP